MECRIVKRPAFTVIGTSKVIKNEEGYAECPKFWDEFYAGGMGQYVCGMYGICVDDGSAEGSFRYMIADDYVPSKDMPDTFETMVIPEHTWAVFPSRGPMPQALQKVNTEIFSQWLPGNSDYEIARTLNIEFYTAPNDYPKGTQDENYYCEIWMPVKAKEQ